MREDIVEFMDTQSRPVADWAADMGTWARLLDESAANLEASRPGEFDELRAAASELLDLVRAPVPPGGHFPRARVARLCSYLHARAKLVADHELAAHEADAMDAAREVAYASVQMLIAMGGDYGDSTEETFA